MDPARPTTSKHGNSAPSEEPDDEIRLAKAPDANLAGGLAALAGLSIARLSLGELLTSVTSVAVQVIPGAEGAGLTLQEKAARADVVVGSAPFVEQVDDIQYGGGEGPCISASASGQIIRSGSVDADPRWPGFGPGAGRLGVHSVLSLPLLADDDLIGSMNVYAHPEDAFDDRAERIGSMFAVSAAVTAQNAHMLAQTQRATANMQEVLTSRAVINQAVGMIVARTGWTAEEALRRLQNQSENEHRTVSAVATTVVEEATRRARRRLRRT